MSSFFNSFRNFSSKRENAIKEALINTLIENSREIQYEVKQRGCDRLELCESTSTLCTTLEAIFLHGLKDSLLWSTINVIAGDEERRPEPSFWAPLLIFLHKQVIEQVQSLSQITSEIGQCRAWIRLSLNESLFSAYLNNVRKSSSALSPYYKKFALLKDGDGLEMAAKAMEGIEAFVQFNLPVNSSLLNYWPDYALQLSGLWTPPLKSCPISSGVDIADTLAIEDEEPIEAMAALPTPQPIRTNEAFTQKIENLPSIQSPTAADIAAQRENVDLLLKAVDEMQMISEENTETVISNNATGAEIVQEDSEYAQTANKTKKKRKKSRELAEARIRDYIAGEAGYRTEPTSPTTPGNSLVNLMHTSWSADEASASELNTPTLERPLYRRASSNASTLSYNTLLGKHEREKLQIQIKNNALTVERTSVTHAGADDAAPQKSDNNGGSDSIESQLTLDFEVVPNSNLAKMNVSEIQEMLEQTYKLARQPGLDAQGFLCKSCQHPLGIGYTNFQVCGFSGNYFCDNCMDMEQMMIPAKIIYNWDFRKYTVSKRAAAFLTEFRNQPVIDLELLNPEIYNASDAMADLQSLRIRLNFLRAYLYTCEPKSIQLLQQQFYGREYLYEHIHLYSISDLLLILRGTLCQQLQKAYKIGESHVLKCPLCSVKGFICEICKSSRVLYPFHIETTYRCEICGAVFHAQCLNDQQPCPKCERRRKREELDLEELNDIENMHSLNSSTTIIIDDVEEEQ
ncbi:pleckstrin homology domain-containing family M member 1 [Anastrepha obliqua]|uniref:pleckstrin homology domain-containing family M member 1 n=1 Tax=Anastrepha obliqua TaxID=95512 RepID=UPI0024091817|nr:pleckstrin homology domain-containing family M member 1 [Anastrepha obliqua]